MLDGGSGDDVLIGGGGADVFVFNKAAGSDTILDFDLARDMIEISNGARSLDDLAFAQSGDDVTFTFADTEITVQDMTVGDLQDADLFLFT